MDISKFKPGKRSIVIGTIAVLAAAAVWLNWNYQKENSEAHAEALSGEYEAVDSRRILSEGYEATVEETADTQETASDYFDITRLSRSKARDEAVSILESTEASVSVSDESRDSASAKIAQIAEDTVVEARIEGLILAKGYRDCVAYINENGCNVVVAATDGALKSQDVAIIKDIVVSETGMESTMIKIVEAVD